MYMKILKVKHAYSLKFISVRINFVIFHLKSIKFLIKMIKLINTNFYFYINFG